VPTYILGPNKAEDNKHFENLVDGEVCTNLTYLGKRGVYTLSSGVKIAILSLFLFVCNLQVLITYDLSASSVGKALGGQPRRVIHVRKVLICSSYAMFNLK